MIEIPRYFSIPGRTITVAIPKELGATLWKMDSVTPRSNGVNGAFSHADYDMFQFTSAQQISNHYVFQTRGQFNISDLKSKTVILFS